jgi:3-phosphoshikimate 1-carboxyvinyltransferase
VNIRFEPVSRLRGRLRPPPDKSISHRAALVGAMASEPVCIRNYLHAADTEATLDAIRALGAIVERRDSELVIRGGGLRNVQPPTAPIYVGNAGTLMRLLPGWLSFQRGHAFTLDGDESIRRRPIDRIAEPLRLMGATIEAREGRYPPFTVHGAPLEGIDYPLPMASAQVKSCVLLAGLTTDMTTVVEPAATRDHTERMLARSGASIERRALDGGQLQTTVRNADELELDLIDVPGDLSSAAFLIAAGVLVPGSRLVLEDVGVNWTRSGFLRILDRMGAVVIAEAEPEGSVSEQEPVAEIDVSHGPLEGDEIGPEEVPLAIDELPLVALLGCFAEGETVVRGAQELRIKETDRIAAVVEGLRGLGADIQDAPDGFAVRGTGGLAGGSLDARGDHRLALLGAVAGLASREGVEVVGWQAAEVSYPGFADDLARLAA